MTCKKYAVERAPLTGKIDGKTIKRLNAAQRMHEGLNHQDLVALEQVYLDKMAQFNERERKTSKVDHELWTSNNVAIPAVNEVPVNPSNNTVPPSNNVEIIRKVIRALVL